jgi:D-psicose/D-tagatose/L-ribulose 3-epimerase
VDATAFIGGNVVAGVIASAWQKYLAPSTDAGYRNAVSGIREVAKEARGKGVTIAVEVVNRFESNLLNTAAQAIRFVDAVGEDNVGIHLDTFHMHIEEADAAAAIRACGSRLRYFHVNENHRGYLDAGSIDFAPVFRACHGAIRWGYCIRGLFVIDLQPDCRRQSGDLAQRVRGRRRRGAPRPGLP